MKNLHGLKMLWKFIKFEAKERLFDLALVAFPIFLVAGVVVGSIGFWSWLFGVGACFR